MPLFSRRGMYFMDGSPTQGTRHLFDPRHTTTSPGLIEVDKGREKNFNI